MQGVGPKVAAAVVAALGAAEPGSRRTSPPVRSSMTRRSASGWPRAGRPCQRRSLRRSRCPRGIPAPRSGHRARRRRSPSPEVLIITGMSGAGRQRGGRGARGPRLVRRRQPAAAADRELAALTAGRPARRARGSPSWSTSAGGRSSRDSPTRWSLRRRRHATTGILFLDATDEVLVRRFERSGGRTRCRATGRSSTASRASGCCSATCASARTPWSTRRELNVHELARKVRRGGRRRRGRAA